MGMIYTLGRIPDYYNYFAEQKEPKKAAGGSVWEHYSDVYNYLEESNLLVDFDVFGVDAEWSDTENTGEEWNDLLIDAPLVDLRGIQKEAGFHSKAEQMSQVILKRIFPDVLREISKSNPMELRYDASIFPFLSSELLAHDINIGWKYIEDGFLVDGKYDYEGREIDGIKGTSIDFIIRYDSKIINSE